MKKKNGFIATSVMFAFFLVFVSLSTLVITSYANYDSLVNALNDNILQTLNEDVIKKKYTSVKNCIVNGDLADGTNNWVLTNATRMHDDTYNNDYIKVTGGSNATITQTYDNCIKKSDTTNKKIYIAYKLNLSNFNCSTGRVSVGSYTVLSDLCNMNGSLFVNWALKSYIITTNDVDNAINNIVFTISGSSGNYFGVEDLMVVDITKLYKDQNCLNNNNCDSTMKDYLDTNLPYFADTYALEKF